MRVLLFAFGEDDPGHPYLPHNYPTDCIAYTGTHDNNTARGWFEQEASPADRKRLFRYLGRKISAAQAPREMVRLASMSRADTAIFPMQDVLGLGAEARMNRPATLEGNWRWRLRPDQATPELADELGEMARAYGRAGK